MGNIENNLPSKKRMLFYAFCVSGPIIGLILLVYLLSMSRTLDFLKWTKPLIAAVAIISVFSFGIPIFGFLDIFIAVKKREKKMIKLPSRAFWTIGLIGIILNSGLLMLTTVPRYIDSGNKEPHLLIMSQTGSNGIPDYAVSTWTESKAEIEINMGFAPGSLTTVVNDEYSGLSKNHAFLLTDLLPDTQYFYKLSNSESIYNFTTFSGIDDDLHIAVASDVHIGAGTNNIGITSKILSHINNDSNTFEALFLPGDLVEYGFMDSMWKQFSSIFSQVTTHIPFRPSVGNHDGFFGGEELFTRYFYPKEIPSSSGSQLYYKIQINNIHIFMLDLEWGLETYTDMQKEWFEYELSSVSTDDWVIVINHAMYYSSGVNIAGMNWWDNEEMISEFEQNFIDYDVDLVFSGHNHHLEVLNGSGICYNIVGGFGGHLDSPRDQEGTGSLWYQQGQYGFADLNISGDMATITYRDPDFNVLNTFNVKS